MPIYIINNLFSREWKYKILCPRNASHRFAQGIFTRLKNHDIDYDSKLMDVDLILMNHVKLKTEVGEDNLWCKIYNKHRCDNKIYQQNMQFLSILVELFGFSSLILVIVLVGIFEFIIF